MGTLRRRVCYHPTLKKPLCSTEAVIEERIVGESIRHERPVAEMHQTLKKHPVAYSRGRH